MVVLSYICAIDFIWTHCICTVFNVACKQYSSQTLYCRNVTSKKGKKRYNLGQLGWSVCVLDFVKWLNLTISVIYSAVKKPNVVNRHMFDIFFTTCQHVSAEVEQREIHMCM